jgi:dimethylamine/trimethylamine dehydrogenase
MACASVTGDVVVFDDDHYYMGAVIAEKLARGGANVTLMTPSAYVSEWTLNTLEQGFIHKRLLEHDVKIMQNTAVTELYDKGLQYVDTYSQKPKDMMCDAIVMTSRSGDDELWHALLEQEEAWADHGIKSIKLIGDAESPAPIAWATFAGHRYARELDAPVNNSNESPLPFRRELARLSS